MFSKYFNKIKRKLGIPIIYQSETSKVRPLVVNYCNGYGCDIGFGGDKILKSNCLGIDFDKPYAYTGKDNVDISCNIGKEAIPLPPNTFDYVYSSHLIEDFEDTRSVLLDFIRVLKSGGNLILIFPDQVKYEDHCVKTGQPLNLYHVHKNMGFEYMVNILKQIDTIDFEILYSNNCEIDYNVILILKINKNENS
jgi:SAM-dependent methyltransferase